MDSRQLRQLLVLANPFKEGDRSVGGTTDGRTRAEARRALGATALRDIRTTPLVDDGVTLALDSTRDRQFDAHLDPLTVDDIKSILLDAGGPAWAATYRRALPSEVIAAVSKVMSDGELSTVARSLFNALEGGIGSAGHFGSRIQPNSPGDDDEEILVSILEGLSYGCGDVVIGLNPASDDVDTIVRLEQLLERVVRRLELPTRFCVLSDILKQRAAQRYTRVDVGFQSLAGTSRALGGMVGLDVEGIVDSAMSFDGLYFETGQGSAVTNGAAEGVDMVTLEARAYGVARHIKERTGRWMIVNDVAGFIGPEVFKTPDQLERACLEDTVMAKLHGLTMGLDVCATFHMGITPESLRALTQRVVARAAPAYLMAVAGNADPMLGYLTTSFRQHPSLRTMVGRSPSAAMRDRLSDLEVGESARGNDVARLYAAYIKAGGDSRGLATLADEGRRRLGELRERGFDLGIEDSTVADARTDRIYRHARTALYATLDPGVIASIEGRNRVNTRAIDRDDYLAHPAAGEQLREDSERLIGSLYPVRRSHVQIVVSDGLNADAINEQLRALLPPLRRLLIDRGHVGEHTVVVDNGRVRVGYDIGALTGAAIVVHIIGERPGTGLNTASAYITYGMTEDGRSRWSRDLDHAVTTAICGIHPKGTPPVAAAEQIARVVSRICEARVSGIALQRVRA